MKRLLTISALFCTLFVQAQIKATSAQERLKTIDQRKQLLSRSTLNETGFRNIGPSIMSGRVVDIEVNPQDPTEFYVAYASGGLWHTQNNGQSFAPIFDSVDVLTIGDIAVNWQNRHIWVGTGEVNSSRSTYAGLGVYRSANNGKSWEYLGLPESHHIGKIQLSAKDPNTAWVAVLGHLYSESKERGIYKTTDAGKNWNLTLASDANTGVSTSRKPRASRATLIPEIACERRVNTERLCRFSMRSASRCRDRCSIGLGRPRLSPGLTREVESNSNPCTRTDSSPDALETTSPLTPMRSPRCGGSCRGEASLNICNVAPPDSSVANQIPP